jgi:hypothetical protein
MFVVERATEIKEFIDSVLDSIGDMARGNVAGAAAKVETALANALPLAISFLARLLNLGGLSERIQSVVNAVRAPINKAIDAVVMGALKLYKRTIGGAVDWAQGKVEAGKRWAKGKAAAIRDRFIGGAEEPAAPEAEAAEEEPAAPEAEAAEEKDDEAEAPEIDPRAEAGALLVERLSGRTELHHVEEEIANVRAELAPHGLRTLELGPENEDGSHPIVATASPPLLTARTVAIERADVVMHVQIGLTAAARAYAVKDKKFYEAGGGRRIADVTERRGPAFSSLGWGLEPDKTGGAALIEPEEDATEIEVVTFSSAGGRRRKDNPSHAEHQFMTFFDRRVPDASQVNSIRITLSHSPCRLCAQEAQRNLADFTREMRGETSLKQRKDAGKLTLELVYDRIHTGSTATRQSDLKALRNAGWDVSGNQDFRSADEIVTVEPVATMADPGKEYRTRKLTAEREAREREKQAELEAVAKAEKARLKEAEKAKRPRRRKVKA